MRPRPEPSGPRSLAPKEHGAYGQLFVPIVAALAMGRPSFGAAGLAIAGSAVFFAHEPALILLGRRGEKARREASGRAKKRLGLLALLTFASGLVAALTVPATALFTASAPLVLGAFVGWLVTRGEEKTTVGEMAAAAALAGVAVPVAIAAGVSQHAAWGAWGAWTIAFGASTWAVRSVIAHQKSPVAGWRRVVPLFVAGAVSLACAAQGVVPWFCAAAAAPMILVALAVAAAPPHPRSLKRVGWSLVGASVAAAAILVAGTRLLA